MKEIHMNSTFEHLEEDVMGFLNEVQFNYPDAISLASGRPEDNLFHVEKSIMGIEDFVTYESSKKHMSREQVYNWLGQYSKTKGVISEYLSKYFKNDYNLDISPEHIMTTVGAQEAMALIVTTLLDKNEHKLIVEDPTYIGCSIYAKLNGYEVESIKVDESGGIDLEILEYKIQNQQKKSIKLVYVIPDFQNPTGLSMPLSKRIKILELASKYDFFILEDNPYGRFRLEGVPIPTLKELDKNLRVIYVESFSKTIFPSIRIAAVIADQLVFGEEGEVLLIDKLATLKGYITVNTSLINQAMLGGMLLKNNYSLDNYLIRKVDGLRKKRDIVVRAIIEQSNQVPFRIKWEVPEGGFFLRMKLPFEITKKDVIEASVKYGVIFSPMRFFGEREELKFQIRIAFCAQSEPKLKEAIKRMFDFLKNKYSTQNEKYEQIK